MGGDARGAKSGNTHDSVSTASSGRATGAEEGLHNKAARNRNRNRNSMLVATRKDVYRLFVNGTRGKGKWEMGNGERERKCGERLG